MEGRGASDTMKIELPDGWMENQLRLDMKTRKKNNPFSSHQSFQIPLSNVNFSFNLHLVINYKRRLS